MDLKDILAKHAVWLAGGTDGVRADLSSADLSSADLSSADLRYADLRYADLRYADLRYANLSNANLSSADLSGANLSEIGSMNGATGNMRHVKSLQADYWPVTYTSTHLQIGCQLHTIAEWWAFGDAEIAQMDGHAVVWWAVWKPILQKIIETSPAEATK